MKSFTIYLIFLFSPFILSQTNPVKQITNFEFDSRNPSIVSMEWDIGELFIEGVTDSGSNIFSLKYNPDTDSFYQLTQITSNNHINTKVTGAYVYNYPLWDYRIILWETNQSGNWDIAFSVDSGFGWTTQQFFLNSGLDELDPSFIYYPGLFGGYYQNYQLVYTKGNSVFLLKKDTVDNEEILFEGNDSVMYSNAVIAEGIAAAERRIQRGMPEIVYRQKHYLDTAWSEIKVIQQGSAENPGFIIAEYNFALSFEIFFEGKRKVLWINFDDLGSSDNTHELLDDPTVETSDFFTLVLPVTVTKSKDYFDPYNPYSFRYARNDSTFIRSSINNVWDTFYVDIYTKVADAHSFLDVLGYFDNNIVSYTIWEDSANGKVNLFGLKRINVFGDVKKELTPEAFSLSQNYPNPFNPNTKIQYELGSRQFVRLKIYDILGREISILVNEEKPAGNYEIEFDGSELSSGIYFYKLQTENYSSVKKMIYLK